MTRDKTQILLINPCRYPGHNEENSFDYGQKFMPLGLLYLGTFLENNGYRVKIIDAPMDKNFREQIKKTLEGNNDLVLVGLSSMTVNIGSALEITKLVKNLRPNVPVVWGGIHPTLFPLDTCKNPLIDYVVYGDGELPLLELADSLRNKKDVNHIKGLVYKKENELFFNKETYPELDINELPIVDYDLLKVEKYIYKNIDITGVRGGEVKRVMPILSGRGCPYHCTFCINKIKEKKRRREKTAEKILQEIDYVVKKYQAEFIHFEDEIFLLNRMRTEKLLEGLEKRDYKIDWSASIRANFYKPQLVSEEILARMRKNGCLNLGIGIESGSPRMLGIFQKQITVPEIKQAATLNYKYGFITSYSFIIGAPGEKEEEVFQTLNLARELKEIDPNGTMIFHTFRPQPGCELYEESIKLGFRGPKNLEGWGKLTFNSLRGYCSPRELPWLKQDKADFYEYLTIFGELTFQNLKRIKKILRIPAWIIGKIFLWRLKKNFWHFLVEMHLYFFLKRFGLFKYIRKVFSSPAKK